MAIWLVSENLRVTELHDENIDEVLLLHTNQVVNRAKIVEAPSATEAVDYVLMVNTMDDTGTLWSNNSPLWHEDWTDNGTKFYKLTA